MSYATDEVDEKSDHSGVSHEESNIPVTSEQLEMHTQAYQRMEQDD